MARHASKILLQLATIEVLGVGGGNETARVHHAPWWRSGHVAAHSSRAAAADAGDWLSKF